MISDKQKRFCLYFLQSFNARQSAIKAGYSGNYGYVLLKDKEVDEFIRKTKQDMMQDIYIEGKDIINLYIKIAFANIEDFVYVKDNKTCLTDHFDGSIVDEITTTANGVKVKLADRFKATEKLEKFFDVFGFDSFKKFIEEKKLSIRDKGTNRDIMVITGVDRKEENEREMDK